MVVYRFNRGDQSYFSWIIRPSGQPVPPARYLAFKQHNQYRKHNYKKKGGQFEPEYPGQFEPGTGGHFKSESGGQFERNLHSIPTETEYMHFWLYSTESVQQPKHKVSASTSKANGSHYVEYEFNESYLYQQYLTQIINMNPEDGGVSKVDGGTGRIYNVGGLTFVLRTFPAGMKAENTVYTVALTEDRR